MDFGVDEMGRGVGGGGLKYEAPPRAGFGLGILTEFQVSFTF
jgi:hypothetical protein